MSACMAWSSRGELTVPEYILVSTAWALEAKAKAEEKVKEKLQDELGDKLKGLFK